MIRYNTITTIWLVGALTFILSALLLAFHVRCKAKQISPPRFLWLIVFSNLLLALDMLVHLHGCYFDTDATASCAIDIAFLLLLIPIYYFALSDVLRKTSEKETPSDPQSTESHHPVTEEPLTLSVEEPLTSPADDILPQTISSEKIVAQWISERHFTDPEITIDKALEQMNISISVLNYYIEQYTNSGTFRRWLSHLRVEEAKRMMLEHPEYSLQAIAVASGYSNNQSLTKSFKAQEGIPPSEWLSRHQARTSQTAKPNNPLTFRK